MENQFNFLFHFHMQPSEFLELSTKEIMWLNGRLIEQKKKDKEA